MIQLLKGGSVVDPVNRRDGQFDVLIEGGRIADNRTYPEIGVPDGHHAVSHHQHNAELVSKKSKIDTFHVSLLASFLEKLRPRPIGTAHCSTSRCCSTAADWETATCTAITACRCWS